MKIYDAKKIEIADVPVTKNAKHEQELMKSDYIRLEWSQEEYMPLPVGAYIEHEGVKYSLFEQYVPDNNGGVYQYKPEFQHPMMLLAHTPCLLTTRDSGGKEIKQTDWTYTGILSTILGRLQGIIYDQLGIMLTFETKFKPTTDVEESATCTFSGVDIISAFSEVCNQFGGIEYHIDWDGKTVWFGDIFLGDEVSLEEGGNVGMASKSMNSKDYANYFIVRGGTRNITNKTASGDNVQSDSRLSIDDIDKRASAEQPKVQKILTFDYIYPQLDLYVYNVRKRVRRLKDEDKQYIVKRYNADGTVAEYKTYAVYYMRLAYKEGEAWKDYIINNPSDDIVAGKKLTASFETNEKGTHSQLAGREYELIYHKSDKTIIANPTIGDSGVNILSGDYEIVFEQDGDLIIPNIDTLQPWGNSTPDDTCDKVVLYNIVMSDEYIANAKVRLAEEAEKEIMRQYTDKTNYTVHSNPIEFAKRNPGLSIGRAVRYRTLSGEVMSTRINRLSTQLDYPIEQEITLGNAVIKGNTQQLREDVKSISVAIDVNESSATRINSMLNSVMRELMEYDAHLLHKDRDDETAYKLTMSELLVKGIAKILSNVSVGGKVSTNSIENDGNNITKGLTKLYDSIMSNGFKNSMTAGSGWQIDKNGNAQVESIEVRSYMRVLELVMNRLSAEESEFIFTESGTVETATFNEDDGTYTLVMRKKTDKDITAFQVDDVLKGVVNDLAEPGAVGVKYYTSWVQVKEVNQTDNSIKVAVYADNDTPAKKNFPPCNLMVLHRWGNTTKEERQSCWYISSIEKRIVMLDGVTQPITTDENLASFYGLPFDMENFKGYTLNKNQPYLYVRGAFLQDVCFIDYLGKVVKQERYRGVWSQEVANSNDPYKVTQTTFDTVYHNNAKWQCNSTEGTKEEPSVGTTDWTMLTDGGKAITVDSTDVYYCIFSSGEYAPDDNYEGWTQIVPPPTKEKPYLWTRTRWYFSDGTITPTYTVVRNGKDGAPGRNLTRVVNYYKWGVIGTEAPSGDYTENNIPPHTDGLDYLWNYEVCYSDNDVLSQTGKTCIGYFPKDGAPGKGIASITEYYQIGTERKPAAISISTDGTTVTIPSGWEPTIDTTTPDKRYVWNQEVIKYSNNTYSVTAVHLAGAQGDKGEDGNGMEYIYMRTEGCKAPNTPSTNVSTPTGWTKEPSGVNAEYPYEWVSMRIQEKGVWGSYSKPILWKEYYALNANLLEQTDFDGLLTKWESRSRYEGTSYEDDSINHISNDGKDGVNCYYDISSRMKSESLYKDVLIQRLVNGSVTRLKPSTWYTLSFYAKCGVNVKPVNITSNEYGFGARVVYLERGKRYKFSISGRIDSQAKNDGKILKGYVCNGDWSWFKDLFIDTTTDAVKSIEFSDVPSNGTYQFMAYMSENGGSRAGKVTLNWANVEEIDGGLFSTYIYPSLVDNTKVFVDGEQKAVSSDCNVTYKASSSDWVRHTVTFKTRNTLGSKQNLLFRMLPIVMSDNTHYLKICMPKLEVGKVASAWQLNEADRMGKNGKPLVGPTMWDSSVWYMSGKADDEAYQSIVINPKYSKQMYLCGYSHSGKEPSAETSTSSVDTCTEEMPWVQVPYQDFVATKVLFAERGKIENLDITNATIEGTITDMAVKTRKEWDAITNALVPNADKGLTEYERNFQIVDPSKAGSYFIPTIDSTSSSNSATVYERGPQIVFLPTYNPSTDYDIITSKITTSNTGKKRYNIPKYQIAGTHIRITKGGAPRQYLRWAYLEDAEYDSLWNRNNGSNRNTIRDIYDMGTLICADHKIFKVTDGHDMQGAWYYGDSDYKHGRFSVNGTVARMLWLMPGQTVELVSQIEEINRKKCLVWSVVNSSDFTAVNINADLYNRSSTHEPIKFHGESGVLDPALAGNANNWEDCFIGHRKIDNLLLGGVTKELPRLFINRNGSTYDNGNPIANFYIP